jgi:hypothetical protein
MLEIVQITKKYGVTGVLVAWLWITNDRVNALENKLVNCYQMQVMNSNKSVSEILYNQKFEAILTKETKIKRV